MASVKQQREAAEQQLGIHAVYQTAQEAQQALESTLDSLRQSRANKRTLETEIASREAEVMQDTWAKFSDAAVTKLDKLVKVEIQGDGYLKDLRRKLHEIISEIELCEADKEINETEIRIACARMNELNGYLVFISSLMAAVSPTQTGS